MKSSKLIKLLSLAALCFSSLDLNCCWGEKQQQFTVAASQDNAKNSAAQHAIVYPPAHEFEFTTVTAQPGARTTKIIDKKFNHPVVEINGKYFQLGKEITGDEKNTVTRSVEVYCCGCQTEEYGLAAVHPCVCLCALTQECCKRRVNREYPA